jgi:vacuolar-type H+-ATPase subunit H
MNLSEVFSSLLSAEDQATKNLVAAKDDVEKLRRDTYESFEDVRKTTLHDAHAEARALVEAARQRGHNEAIHILSEGASERDKITELLEKNVRDLVASLVNEVADEYVSTASATISKYKKNRGAAKC